MTEYRFTANYRRWTQETTDLLMRISAALGVINGARVLPAVADQLRASARAGTVHYSNLIEGNELPFVEAERAARHELPPDTRAVLAGVLHHGVTDVHPFADGNGRAARLLQTAILMSAGVLPGRMFSFERYYAEDRSAYYAALRSVRERTLNMEFWLVYFLTGLAEEYERVAATVTDLSKLLTAGGDEPLRLTAGQERAVAALRMQGRSEFTRREYEQAASVGRSTALDEISQLVRHGVVVTHGSGPSTRYAFATMVRASAEGVRRGRPPMWNDTRIEQELRSFLAGKTSWPTQSEFTAEKKGALYAAASRAGGLARWRRMFGL